MARIEQPALKLFAAGMTGLGADEAEHHYQMLRRGVVGPP
jgi:hypothetical protein